MGQNQEERDKLLEEIDAAILAAIRARLNEAGALSIGDLKSLAGIVKDMGGSRAASGGGCLTVRFEGEAEEFSK